MTDAPKRIWTDYFMANKLFLAFSDPPVNEFNDCRDEYILAAEHERLLSEARNKALEEAAKVAERDCDWIGFGKAGIEQWDGGPDAVRDYRLGIRAGRSIAAAIRALVLD